MIPPVVRQYAGLDREVVLIGVLDHFEIWSQEKWLKEDARFQNDLKKEDMRNEVAALGL